MTEQRKNILVIVGLALFAFLLTMNFSANRSVHIYDEVHCLLAANTISRGVLGVVQGSPIAEIKEQIHQSGGTLYFIAKPFYIFLVASLGVVSGGVSAKTGYLVSALAAALAVGSIGAIVLRFHGRRAAVYTGLLLALSPFFLLFAGTTLPIMTAVAFSLLAAALAIVGAGSRLCLVFSGIAAAAAVLSHYLVLPTLGIFYLWLVYQRGWKANFPTLIGGIGFLLLIEIAMRIVGFALRSTYPEFKSFGQEVFGAFTTFHLDNPESDLPKTSGGDGVRGYGTEAMGFLFNLYIFAFGPIALLGLLWGSWKAYQQRSGAYSQFFLIFGTLTFLLWMIYPWKVERSYLLPLAPSLAAVGVLLSKISLLRSIPIFGFVVIVNLLITAGSVTMFGSGKAYLRFGERNSQILESLPDGALTGASIHRRSTPQWKWYLGADRINRGMDVSFANWSSQEPSDYIIVDRYSHYPDNNYPADYDDSNNWRAVTPWDKSSAFEFAPIYSPLGRFESEPFVYIQLRQRIHPEEGNQ